MKLNKPSLLPNVRTLGVRAKESLDPLLSWNELSKIFGEFSQFTETIPPRISSRNLPGDTVRALNYEYREVFPSKCP